MTAEQRDASTAASGQMPAGSAPHGHRPKRPTRVATVSDAGQATNGYNPHTSSHTARPTKVADVCISSTAYADAVARLAAGAEAATAAGEASARVLLSCYDAWEWGFTAADLARLARPELDAALTTLHARAELGPPQDGAAPRKETGAAYLASLARRWRPAETRPAGHSGAP